jgi:hypothetical protein
MSLIFGNDVKETSTTTGTGTLSLAGAASNSRTFVAGIGNGNETAYKIDDGAGNREYTFGQVASGTPDTLTRGTLISSTTGSRISFGAGTKTISCVPMSEIVMLPGVSPVVAESDIASATTTDLGTIKTLRARVTGTTTITSFGTQPHTLRWVRFAGALTLTHNATSLILIGAANRPTAANDVGLYISDASGNWREIFYSADEIGTFTPTLQFGGAAVGMSISAFGYYTKRGNRVFYNLEFTLTNKGSSTGTALIGGLPYTSANVSGGRSAAAIVCDAMSGLTVAVAYVGPNSAQIALQNFVSNALASMTNSNFTNTSNVMVSGHYRI